MTLAPWDADVSQSARIVLAGSSPVLDVTPALAAPPAAVQPVVLRRVTVTAGAPVLADGTPVDWAATDLAQADWGTLHVFVDGVDVTYARNKPILVGSYSTEEPFGEGSSALQVPGVTSFDTVGAGDLAWWRLGAQVDIAVARPDGTVATLWAGFIASDRPDLASPGSVECAGALQQAGLAQMQATMSTDPIDVGAAVAAALTGVVSRRYGPVAAPATGIMTRQRGDGQTVLDYVQSVLALAATSDGGQWTVTRTGVRQYAIQVKDRDTVHATVRHGVHGVTVSLAKDLTTSVNVIYGRGVGPDGYAYAHWFYPGMGADDAPPYPNASASNVITVGETDADTDSGTGVSTWEQRARELGHDIPVDGVYSSADAQVCRDIQRRYGILVDGIIGPQTWTATFEVGSNAGDLDNPIRLPLAADPAVMPRLYTADGGDAGPNPAYNPSLIRIERDVNYGAGIAKADAIRSAQAELARDGQPGWVGTIELDTDPPERSRWEIAAGMNVKVLGWRGGDVLVHVAHAEVTPGGRTRLTVDSKARDLLTVAALTARDQDAAPDPARRPGNVRRRSQLAHDSVVAYDGESSAGVVPRHGLFGGLWNVLRIPVSQVGRVAKIDYRTEGPAAQFVMALFGAPVTAADLVRLIGNPLAAGNRSWVEHTQELEDAFGWIETFGGPGQALGHWPGSESEGDPVTGRHVETGGLEYVSARPPWIWVAEFSQTSCFASGRIYPAPVT